jgi:hypothetical protein
MATAKSQSQKLMLFPPLPQTLFPSPVSHYTEICFGLRLAHPVDEGNAEILRSMSANSHGVWKRMACFGAGNTKLTSSWISVSSISR